MSANPYLSKHLPGMAGGVVSIAAAATGLATIQTGLKVVRSVSANIKASAIAANQEGIVVADWGGSLSPGEILFTVEKIGSASGDAADSDVDVTFTAMGDR